MSYCEQGRVWVDYLGNVDKTINRLAVINQTCEDTIKMMYLIDAKILDSVIKQWGRNKLPNDQVFVSVYYKRNISYLQSAYILASIGFISPSSNLSRTVFETLLREYLFIVDKQEADEYYQVIGTERKDLFNIRKGVKYLREKLYSDNRNQTLKKLYSLLCASSHPSIKGANLDFPNYSVPRIDDTIKSILLLMYGNIEVLAESFYSFLDNTSKPIIKTALENIAFDTRHALTLEPDKEPYASLIKLKNGNFNQVL